MKHLFRYAVCSKSKLLISFFSLMLFSSVMQAQTTLYSYKSAVWNDANTWTIDPSGALWINPSSEYPQAGDKAIILAGINIDATAAAVACDELKVEGTLDLGALDKAAANSTIGELNGSGFIKLASDNFPTVTTDNFNAEDEGEGTTVFYGTSFDLDSPVSYYNVDVQMSTNEVLQVVGDLTVDGNLTVTTGAIRLDGDNNPITPTTVKVIVNGNLMVTANGTIAVGPANVFHWLEVYGNFVNAGIVDFTNTAQYTEATNGAIKLKFKGTTDTYFTCNGSTEIYRLFVDKGSDKTYGVTVSANQTTNFDLMGPVSGATNDGEDGAAGYEKLPIVLEHGTLVLGSNIEIDRLGENMDGSLPKEFTIPVGTRLWINGADVTSSTGTGDQHGLLLLGDLKVSSGTLTTPASTEGLYYDTDGTSTPVIEIEGGDVYLTQIWTELAGSDKFIFRQSGGSLYFNAQASDHNNHAVFHLNHSDHIFEMTGGEMHFSVANNGNGHVTGIRIESAEGNYNVTGGTINITEPVDRVFSIYSLAPLYNIVTIDSGSAYEIQMTNTNGQDYSSFWEGDLKVLNNITIGANTTFNDRGNNLFVGGDLTVAGVFTQSAATSKVILNRAQDGAINNNTASELSLTDVLIAKDKHASDYYTITLGGINDIDIEGSLNLQRGAFDPVNFWPSVGDSLIISDGKLTSSGTGGIELDGSSQQVLKGSFGKDYDFGDIKLNNGDNGAALATDIDVTDFAFASSGSAKVDMGSYNLSISGSLTNYTSNRYFKTGNSSSDGGLSLQFTVPSSGTGTIAFFPVGTTVYAPCEVQNTGVDSDNPSGLFTVVPINDHHPSTTDESGVLAHYWKTRVSGFTGLDDNLVRLTFNAGINLKNLKCAYLDNQEWIIGSSKFANGVTDLIFDSTAGYGAYSNLIASDYTAGLDNGSGKIPISGVLILTSTDGQNWHDSSWTDQDGNPNVGPPTESDIAIIDLGHTVTINANNAVASQLEIKGALSVSSGTSGHTIDIIKGDGRLIYENDLNYGPNNVISGDHKEFSNSVDAIIEFSGTGSYWMPAQSAIPYYPNLHITGGSTKHTPYNGSVNIGGELFIDDATLELTPINNGELSIGGDLRINTGELVFSNNRTHNVFVGGDIDFDGAGTLTGGLSGGTPVNAIYLQGGINLVDGATIDFNTANFTNVVFEGDDQAIVSYETGSTSATVDFYQVYVDKTSGVVFNTDFDLRALPVGATKSLILQAGECQLNNVDLDIDLTTGSNDFEIPSGTTLRVTAGEVYASGNSGISLDGSLIIDGGVANFDGSLAATGTNGNSYIEYTASGNAAIEVSNSGALTVGSQIRRSTSLDNGVLSFVQNGGVVTIGSVDELEDTRGIFEIMGEGSSFTQAAGDVITIQNSNGSLTVPTLYFDAATVSFGAGAGFTFDVSNEQGAVFGVYANEPLNNLTTTGGTASGTGSGNSIQFMTVNPVINGALSVGENTTLDADGLDLYLAGDFINAGAYTHGNNTTYFTGVAAQQIGGAGSTELYNVDKSGAGLLSVNNATVAIARDLSVQTGASIDTKALSLSVEGDVLNDGAIVSDNGADGIIMNGVDSQSFTGEGSIDCLTISNSDGVYVPSQSGAFSVGKQLQLTDGTFDIGRNLLELGTTAIIVDGSGGGFGTSNLNMVQTNLSFTDAGIEKYFADGYSQSFVYPIGSFGKYTPVTLDVTSYVDVDGGSIRVKASNEPHVSVEPANQGNVLQYNWTLDADGVEGLKAIVSFEYEDADALIDDDTDGDYIAAKILLGSDKWDKENGLLTPGSDLITYDWTGVGANDATIDGDYTAGNKDAIPDKIATYITYKDGSWSDEDTWAVYDPETGDITYDNGNNIPTGGPAGVIVYVAHNLTFPASPAPPMVAYRTVLQSTGVLDVAQELVANTRLGDVSGEGLLRTYNGTLPVGVYSEFCEQGGGTVEFYGSGSYSVLLNRQQWNNVLFSGSGTKTITESQVILGSFTVNGPTVDVSGASKNIKLAGNLTVTSGSLDFDEHEVEFVGNLQQTISSDIAFYDLKINNNGGLLIDADVDVSNNLDLTNGIIEIGTGSLILGSSATSSLASDDSYVEGVLYKNYISNTSFTYPVGDAYRSGNIVVKPNGTSTGVWGARYFNPNDKAPDSKNDTNVNYVSTNEYWQVEAPATGDKTANVTLRWDTNSGVEVTDVNTLNWTAANGGEWDVISHDGGSVNGSDSDSSGDVAILNIIFGYTGGDDSHYFTFGLSTDPTYTWQGDVGGSETDWFTAGNWENGKVPNASSNVVIPIGLSDYPIVTTTALAQVNDITIGTGGSAVLTLEAGATMTVNGDVTGDNNCVVIQNTVTNPTSFICNGTVTPHVQIEWKYDSRRYWYVSHSISNANISSYEDIVSSYNNAYLLNKFTNTGWSDITGTALSPDVMEGYSLNIRDEFDVNEQITHSGELNNLDSYTRVINAGWCLMANPYSSYIDLDRLNEWNFGQAIKSVWIATDISPGVRGNATYNVEEGIEINGSSNFIAPGQAYWVRTYTNGDVFQIKKGAQVHGAGAALKSSDIGREEDVLRLGVSAGGKADEMAMAFRYSGHNYFSSNDSEKKLVANASYPQIYSIKSGKNIAIDIMPMVYEEKEVSLGFVAPDGSDDLEIRAANISSFLPDLNVWLIDKALNDTINLRKQNSYSFSSELSSDVERFAIKLEPKEEVGDIITGNEEGSVEADNVSIFVRENRILEVEAITDINDERSVKLMSLTGSELFADSFYGRTYSQELSVAPGIYIIQLNIGDDLFKEKVMIK